MNISGITDRIFRLIGKGDDRTSIVKRNIFASFGLKGISIVVGFLNIPITINYLNQTRYGIWVTLSSIVAWFALFDVGLANGLRNKLAEALAKGDKELARKYVSTTYALLTIIALAGIVVFLGVEHWIDWTRVLNTTPDYFVELQHLVRIVFISFCVRFVLQIISIVVIADQKTALGNSFEVMYSVLSLAGIYVLIFLHSSSLINFGIVLVLIPVVVLGVATLIMFWGKYSFLRPGWKHVQFMYARELTGLGVQFFIVQIAVIVIFQTSNILIAQLFSPAEVTPYNVAFKYFSILTSVWAIVMAPMWSAFTHSLAQGDYTWMQKVMSKCNKYMIYSVLIVVVMGIFAPVLIDIWTMHKVTVSELMIWIFAFYTLITVWNNIYAYFLNGTGVIDIQVYTSIIAAVVHIPLAIFLTKKLHMGPEGIVLSMAIALSVFAIAGPIKSNSIMRKWKNSSVS
ncbi:MAG: hypothetical protein LWX56_13245 [Ignavibacteria bacterium]|nr:hypothetical protein [Ignavibacteria bacterium]